ncbi:MAG: DUF2283 domain-containing protein [Cyanophyceae cyanobacterium]
MDKKLIVNYDRIGDILYIDTVKPYEEQELEHRDDDVITRHNPETDEVEGVEIPFFQERLKDSNVLELDIAADFRLAVTA